LNRSDQQRVADILEYAQYLEVLVSKGKENYQSDVTQQFALERIVEIISEACAKLTDEFKADYPDLPWKEIINMRIVLAHIYHRIDSELVWDTAKDSVPLLVLALKSH
jgi:uncharacterized protein with HEPN domain